jgi:hypothetical protein
MASVESHTILDQHVLKTLLYFDIFDYPLKTDEIFRFLGMNSIQKRDVEQSLFDLAKQNLLEFSEGFYGFPPLSAKVNRRLKGNALAAASMPKAQAQALLIAKFPFVRSVMASGSLSKDYMDEDSDLDFFIITRNRRLWIARTLLVLYKRLFLSNSHKDFCVNYFIDESHVGIAEHNLFTATELVIPLYNSDAYIKLIQANPWLKGYFPNFKPKNCKDVPPLKFTPARKITENFLDIIGGPLERIFLTLTMKRWRKLYANKYAKQDFSIAFKTNKHVSKNHPRNYQKKVMELYLQKLESFSHQYQIPLHP